MRHINAFKLYYYCLTRPTSIVFSLSVRSICVGFLKILNFAPNQVSTIGGLTRYATLFDNNFSRWRSLGSRYIFCYCNYIECWTIERPSVVIGPIRITKKYIDICIYLSFKITRNHWNLFAETGRSMGIMNNIII